MKNIGAPSPLPGVTNQATMSDDGRVIKCPAGSPVFNIEIANQVIMAIFQAIALSTAGIACLAIATFFKPRRLTLPFGPLADLRCISATED